MWRVGTKCCSRGDGMRGVVISQFPRKRASLESWSWVTCCCKPSGVPKAVVRPTAAGGLFISSYLRRDPRRAPELWPPSTSNCQQCGEHLGSGQRPSMVLKHRPERVLQRVPPTRLRDLWWSTPHSVQGTSTEMVLNPLPSGSLRTTPGRPTAESSTLTASVPTQSRRMLNLHGERSGIAHQGSVLINSTSRGSQAS